eukprot:5373108-Pleurochrysis_carterae.AAC.1
MGEKSSSETNAFWESMAAAAVTTSAEDPSRKIEHFTVDGIGPVCSEYWAAAYGIKTGTLNPMLSDARSG